jgi:hypothetical protein
MRDILTMKKAMDANPYDYPWVDWQLKAHDCPTMPPITGVIFPEILALSINSVAYLDDIYINQNKFHSKHVSQRIMFSNFIPRSMLFEVTESAHYSDKRKALSAAFFK